MTSGFNTNDKYLNDILRRSSSKSLLGITTINDLRDMEFNNIEITPQHRLALKNFDRYRINQLKKIKSDAAFHNKYMQLQAIANLMPYEEFLKEEYF
ncbi:MAG: hypothetical protein HND27_03345 [Bacteroidetes bacterium]|nr:hypothetical protein [Bacteroidota bacterium]MBV6461072.1 hypothetical protein [Flavobacteriales bacterium]WKZ75531.1 MAG: hypothetical protein QY303_01285 [Vicingaceae bacterium]MCL4815097.1 hypothetical protein [Flavobacteriales bacterium]NOG94796.1 hypothetical protein [Bacteroidota bacterium]